MFNSKMTLDLELSGNWMTPVRFGASSFILS